MAVPKSISLVASAFVIAFCGHLGVAPAVADSILAGTVTDNITLQPVVGAQVKIEYSGQVVGSGTSDIDGRYSVPFTIPPSAPTITTMIASARSGSHEINTSNFQVKSGTPVETTHNITLYPLYVTACRSLTDHSIIVGHFLPPVGIDFPDLSTRVARSLDFALNTRLQTVRLSVKLQPSFEPCDAAKPKTPRLGAMFAKALRADAFVGGIIADGPSSFTVITSVSDAHDLLRIPAVATSRGVDLGNPSGASMAGETQVAVLAAIAAGLERKDDCVSAITVLSVVEQLVDVTPPYVVDLRQRCEAHLPNSGLLGMSQ